MKWLCLLCFYITGTVLTIEHDFKGFDDTILFGIDWPGSLEAFESRDNWKVIKSQPGKSNDILKVTTSNKEKYECSIPELQTKETSGIEDYNGPTPIELLRPLFVQNICSYRLESFWSYEVCHGRFIRQYHEERDGKQVKTHEYYLGYWGPGKQNKLEEEYKHHDTTQETTPRTIKVDGFSLPFVEMAMDDGTICDLNGKSRVTKVLYVCYAHGKHEVYSFRETSTCEYEIVILSPLLCEHPQFRLKDVSENIINCFTIGNAPTVPKNMLKMDVADLKFHHETLKYMNDKGHKDVLAVVKVEKIEKYGETHLKFELHPLNEEDLSEEPSKVTHVATDKPASTMVDDSPVRAFLNGENCLNGGTGWWKYEFCYGKHVMQYHVDRAGEKTTLMLGQFDERAHLDWLQENKGKAPKPIDQRTSISHFYSGGDICDKTGKPRQTEVKLKCFENSSSPAQVSLYLLEPRTCHYILGVESSLICDILPFADENGLIASPNIGLNKQEPVVDNVMDNVDSDKKEKDIIKFGND